MIGERLRSRKFWVAIGTAVLVAVGVPADEAATVTVGAVGAVYVFGQSLVDAVKARASAGWDGRGH